MIAGRDYLSVNLWHEPGNVVSSALPQELRLAEMSDFDHAFLCGLLRAKKPKKILELGVSAVERRLLF